MSIRIDRVSEARGLERGNRVLAMLKPFFCRETVRRIIQRELPQHAESQVLEVLSAYKSESEELTCRIYLGAVRLSDGRLDKLREVIREAKQDFRDVLGGAENRSFYEMDVVAYENHSEDEKDRIADEDLNDYLRWLQKP